MLTAKEIRDSFKNFFESKGHHIVPSAPMVIKDDPIITLTLLSNLVIIFYLYKNKKRTIRANIVRRVLLLTYI